MSETSADRDLTPPAAALIVAAMLVFAVLAWLARTPTVLTAQDDAIYVLLARDLASGHFRDTWVVGMPAHRLYPPGYPLVLTVARAILGERFDALVAVNVIAGAAALGMVGMVVARRLSPAIGVASAWVLAVHPMLVQRSGELFSEPVFTLALVGTTVVASRPEQSRRQLAAAGTLAVAAALVRSAGVTVVAALVLLWLLQRRWRAAALLTAVSVLLLGGWFLHVSSSESEFSGSTYIFDATSSVGEGGGRVSLPLLVLQRVGSHVRTYLTASLPLALPFPGIRGVVADNVLVLVVAMAGLAWGAVAAWSRWRIAVLIAAAMAALLAVWAWAATRFLLPMVPLLVPLMLAGVAGIAALRWKRAAAPSALALALIMGLTGLSRTVPLVRQGLDCQRDAEVPSGPCVRPDTRSYLAAAAAIRETLPTDAVLVSVKPATVYYHSGRQSTPLDIARGRPDSTMLLRAREAGAGWILLGSVHVAEVRRMGPALLGSCRGLSPVDSFPPRTLLLRIKPAGDTSAPDACDELERWRLNNVGRDFSADTR